MEVYLYGMYNGIIMSFSSIMAPVYEKMFKITHINKNARWYRGWQIIRTFILVNISWYLITQLLLQMHSDLWEIHLNMHHSAWMQL